MKGLCNEERGRAAEKRGRGRVKEGGRWRTRTRRECEKGRRREEEDLCNEKLYAAALTLHTVLCSLTADIVLGYL